MEPVRYRRAPTLINRALNAPHISLDEGLEGKASGPRLYRFGVGAPYM